MDEESDHDLLKKLQIDMRWLIQSVNNHLKHHWAITLGACLAAVAAITSVVIMLLHGD